MSAITRKFINKRPYSMQWKAMLVFTVITAVGSSMYRYASGSSFYYIEWLFIWPAIAAVYSGLVYILPELQSKLSNLCVCTGLLMVMAGCIWRGVTVSNTMTSQYIMYLFMAGMMLFLLGIIISLLWGAWKLRC